MDREEFNNLLEQSNLTKKEFCTIIGLKYEAVNNWGTPTIKIPKWVKSWLENYIEKQKHQKMVAVLKESGDLLDMLKDEE